MLALLPSRELRCLTCVAGHAMFAHSVLWVMSRDVGSHAKLRNYPVEFGTVVASMLDELIGTTLRPPPPPEDLPSGPEIFAAHPSTDVHDVFRNADLGSVYDYLRAGKNLRLPEMWRVHFPKGSPDLENLSSVAAKKRKASG